MQWKTYYLQTPASVTQINGFTPSGILTEAKTMGYTGPYIIRERGVTLLIEINGKILERGKLTEKILSDNFPGQTKEWVKRAVETFNH
jgi:hypothetical protein